MRVCVFRRVKAPCKPTLSPADLSRSKALRYIPIRAQRTQPTEAIHVTYLLVGLGGFLGAVCRFAVANWAARLFGGPFPFGTFIANASGSFLLGITLAVLEDKALLNTPQRHFLVAGFLGAYTTFSTFSYESLHLFQHGPMLLGVLNVVGSVALGLLGVWGGFALARWGIG